MPMQWCRFPIQGTNWLPCIQEFSGCWQPFAILSLIQMLLTLPAYIRTTRTCWTSLWCHPSSLELGMRLNPTFPKRTPLLKAATSWVLSQCQQIQSLDRNCCTKTPCWSTWNVMARLCGVAENCRQTIGSGRGETLTFPSCWCASSATNRSREGAGKVGLLRQPSLRRVHRNPNRFLQQ